jgi:hypothetical protein
MKRYNQGFLKFGPMEQCDTGEWVKHSDIDSYLDKYGVQHAKAFIQMAEEMYEENSSIMLKLKVITSALIMSFVANAVFLSVM